MQIMYAASIAGRFFPEKWRAGSRLGQAFQLEQLKAAVKLFLELLKTKLNLI